MNDYHSQKAALLTVLLGQLESAESTLDQIQKLENEATTSPDHDTLAIQDLVADAYDLVESLRNSLDEEAGRP